MVLPTDKRFRHPCDNPDPKTLSIWRLENEIRIKNRLLTCIAWLLLFSGTINLISVFGGAL